MNDSRLTREQFEAVCGQMKRDMGRRVPLVINRRWAERNMECHGTIAPCWMEVTCHAANHDEDEGVEG